MNASHKQFWYSTVQRWNKGEEYQNLMIPITASVGIFGAFICGTVMFASGGAGVVTGAGAIGGTSGAGAASGGLFITGFAVLAR